MNRLLSFVLILGFVGVVSAEELSGIPGAFVDIGYGVRPMGMGGSFVAIADDANAPLWNPAGLINVEHHQFTFMYAHQLMLAPYNYLSYGHSRLKDGLGCALIIAGDDVLRENSFYFSYARRLKEKITLGSNLKLRYVSFGNNETGGEDRIKGNGYGSGWDLGGLWNPKGNIWLGFLFREGFGTVRWNSSSPEGSYNECIPPQLIFGLAHKATFKKIKVNFALDFEKSVYSDTHNRLSIGTEVKIADLLALRAGIGENLNAPQEELNRKYSFGFGISHRIPNKTFGLALDFAYQISDLPSSVRVGLDVIYGYPVDRDNDGILDNRDRCPDTPEDFDGFEDEDGCPEFDNDGDGIPDSLDKCPNRPEDLDGFRDKDGCPEFDNDGDGVPDSLDKCPNTPEDLDGFKDEDGCPEFDNDGDGIPDSLDKCPNEAETKNDWEDEDGCPDMPPRLILQNVQFASGKADIMPESYPILNNVAESLRLLPKVRVKILGHTDSVGNRSYNQKLSYRRALSVKQYLVSFGIDPSRLEAEGKGEDEPIASNKTREGRRQNRRIEFIKIE